MSVDTNTDSGRRAKLISIITAASESASRLAFETRFQLRDSSSLLKATVLLQVQQVVCILCSVWYASFLELRNGR